MVLADVVDERLDGVVVLLTQRTLVPTRAVGRLVFHQVALVHRVEGTLFTPVELASVLTHVGVQVT